VAPGEGAGGWGRLTTPERNAPCTRVQMCLALIVDGCRWVFGAGCEMAGPVEMQALGSCSGTVLEVWEVLFGGCWCV